LREAAATVSRGVTAHGYQQQWLHGEASATFAATRRQNFATADRFTARTKTMRAGAANFVRLISSLHDDNTLKLIQKQPSIKACSPAFCQMFATERQKHVYRRTRASHHFVGAIMLQSLEKIHAFVLA
jgi:hypothetical protein